MIVVTPVGMCAACSTPRLLMLALKDTRIDVCSRIAKVVIEFWGHASVHGRKAAIKQVKSILTVHMEIHRAKFSFFAEIFVVRTGTSRAVSQFVLFCALI
jgi:hypothetical protein